MVRKIFVLSFILFFTSCSSVRMKYEATIVDDMFHTAQFEYYKSYDVGNLDTWCLATGIFLGGACWKYLSFPSKELEKSTAKDARRKLEEIFGINNFKHSNISVASFGWSELPEDYIFPSGEPLVNNSPYIYKRKGKSSQMNAVNTQGVGEN
ncbi:MAG: hypothetical protein KC493_16910 [Bacteriovoracaceae bacterium]|nr:hypothetical protein [Bacteriovoracaceae bacterium]